MSILFSRSKIWWSSLICSVLDEPYSHCSIRIKDTVYQSNFKGVHSCSYDSFLQQQDSVVSLSIPEIPEFKKKFDKYKNSWYDLGAMLFIGFSFLLRRYFKIPLPKANLWQSTGMFLCTEFVTQILTDEELSMITPYQLYNTLKAKNIAL